MKKFPRVKLPCWMQEILKPDVIKTMRVKFVATAMGILVLVFMTMLGLINMIMKTVSQSQSMQLLEKIAESDRYNTLNNEPETDKPLEDIPPPELQQPVITENVLAEIISENQVVSLGWMPWDGNYNPERPEEKKHQGNMPDNENFPDEPPFPEDWHGRESELPLPEWQESEYVTESNLSSESEFTAEITEIMIPTEIPAIAEPEQFEPEISLQDENIPDAVQEEPVFSEEFTEDSQITELLSETEQQEITASESETETEHLTTETETVNIQTVPEPPKNHEENREFRLEPRPDKWKVNIMLDHFALMADENGNFLDLRNTENYTNKQASEILTAILHTGKQQGMYNWLQYYKTQKSYGTLIVVTEKSSDQALLNNLFRTTAVIGILMLFILFIFLIFFSGWITKPVQVALERQKQFVSDAGHELKTPLAVLTANADILKDEIGENKWLGYMQEQTDRMSQLVGDLLRLARMDNATQEYSFEEFNLSTAIEATVLPFESQAFELQKNLEMDIQPDISYYGSQQHIRQLTAIFIDNALKYSDEHGIIKITLLQRGDDRILEFYNTGCEISQEETNKIFERFYRGDKARNNKGKNGYGLGLAIAKSIMQIHKIKIQITCEQDAWIRFLMIL